ncbi:MAG: four helix bundle protein [Desulfobacterales bacterium]
MLKNYKELKVWQKSYQLCLAIYKATNKFPKKESLSELLRDIGEVERMLKALIKSLENKHLNP